MRAAIQWLDDALGASTLVHEMTHFQFSEDGISSTDGRLKAFRPCDTHGIKALVPGSELRRILKATDKELTVSEEDNFVRLSAGRFKAKIPILDERAVWDTYEPEGWAPLPVNLVEAVRQVRPFVAEDATHLWAMGVVLSGNNVIATNNVCLASVPCELHGSPEIILPVWAVDFLLDRSNAKAWSGDSGRLAFKWEDGSWMTSVLIDDKFPANLVTMLEEFQGKEPPTKITEDFRAAYGTLAPLADSYIEFHAEHMSVQHKTATVEEGVGCAVPEGSEYTRWTVKHLDKVMQVATEWDPGSYPKPSAFKGPLVSGCIVGRT